MIKTCLDAGDYACTLYDVFYDPTVEDRLIFIWIVDTGTNKWHKLFENVPLGTRTAARKLNRIGLGINVTLDPERITEKKPDLSRLIGKRAVLTIDFVFSESRRAWVNIIGAYSAVTKKPDVDVLRPVTDDNFKKGTNKKRLPINNNE